MSLVTFVPPVNKESINFGEGNRVFIVYFILSRFGDSEEREKKRISNKNNVEKIKEKSEFSNA